MDARGHVEGQLEVLSRAVADGGIDAVDDSYDERCVLIDHTAAGEGICGRPAVAAYWDRLFTALPRGRLDWAEPIVDGRSVVVELRLSGRHVGEALRGRPASGNVVDLPLCSVWRLAQDRDVVLEQHLYYDGDSLDCQLARGVL